MSLRVRSDKFADAMKRRGWDYEDSREILCEIESLSMVVVDKKALQDSELLEKLAALEHEQWIDLMQHLFSENLIHLSHADSFRIKQLTKMPYERLEHYEKESDRKFARKVLELLKKELLAEKEEVST